MQPIDIVREGYARYERRDFAGVFQLLSSDVEFSQTETLPWGGVHRGHEGARDFFARLNQHTDATPRPITYVPAGDDVAVIGRLTGTARATGRPIDLDIVHVWTVKAGKIVRFAAYIDTPAMRQALGTD
ncbi:hypothetical protein SAMN06265795_12330 [Noviherbaspirillum humi]|uniref:SnoaL-like domain-containing protein n=1 Tax=Noviherbaspirillum humi TaxID=1688639 RepID=A0A239LKP7_9BURK|nr:nuclear transport factor 2 family protein [Noviherbaspirillum humi]SNT30154.1 hypothetical protein SAMN06265795_12330 [Noviherbaspirillum humi]